MIARDPSFSLCGLAVGVCLAATALPGLSHQATSERRNAVEVTKPSDREIALEWTFAARRQEVFDALTQQDQVPRWFQPARMSLVTYTADLRVGGISRYVFQRPSGKRIEMTHTYKEIDPPRRWVHAETYDFSPLTLLVTTSLEEALGKTVVTQTYANHTVLVETGARR